MTTSSESPIFFSMFSVQLDVQPLLFLQVQGLFRPCHCQLPGEVFRNGASVGQPAAPRGPADLGGGPGGETLPPRGVPGAAGGRGPGAEHREDRNLRRAPESRRSELLELVL